MTHFCRLMGTGAGRNAMATRGTGLITSARGAFSQRLMGNRHLHLSLRQGEREASSVDERRPCMLPSRPDVPMDLPGAWDRQGHESGRARPPSLLPGGPAPAGPLASLLLCSPAHLASDGVLSTAYQSGAALGGALRRTTVSLRTLHLRSPHISTRPGASRECRGNPPRPYLQHPLPLPQVMGFGFPNPFSETSEGKAYIPNHSVVWNHGLGSQRLNQPG